MFPMMSDAYAAILAGIATFALLRGRMIQGDIAAAILAVLYLSAVGVYATILQPGWGLIATFARVAFLSAISFASLWACFAIYRTSPLHPLHGFPGPVLNRITELPLAYAAARLRRHVYLCELHERYGPVVRTGPNSLSFNTGSAAHTIHRSAQCFNKTDAYDLHLKGEGLFFTKDRDRHAVLRRPWNRAMSVAAVQEYTEPLFRTIQALVTRLVKDTQEKGSVDLVRCTRQWAFDTAALITFGGNGIVVDLLASDDPGDFAYKPMIALASFEFFSHFPWLFYIVRHLPSAVFPEVEDFALKQAERRLQAEKIQFQDVFSYWVEDAEQVDLDALATDSLAAIVAATDTLSSMTALLFFFILSHPSWKDALRAELFAAFPAHAPLSASSAEKLDELPVLNAIIHEGFRLGAIFAGLPRVVPAGGATVDGHRIPAGTTVSVPIYAQHLSAEHFGSSSTDFDPERWLSGEADRSALLAFGAGPFNCVGQRLAYKQTRLVLACVFLLLDVEVPEGFDAARFWKGVVNLRATIIREPLKVVARRREAGELSVVFPSV